MRWAFELMGVAVTQSCLWAVVAQLTSAGSPLGNSVTARLWLFAGLVAGLVLSAATITIRQRPTVGFVGLWSVLLASFASRFLPSLQLPVGWQGLGDLDWLLLNVALSVAIFVPLERLFPAAARASEPERDEWRDDLFYYFISNLLFHLSAALFRGPLEQFAGGGTLAHLRAWIPNQPWPLQFIGLMIIGDFLQYWHHRAFHAVPFLWRVHSIHHSSKTVDWIASLRVHALEIFTRSLQCMIPVVLLGISSLTAHLYLVFLYYHSAMVHANIGIFPRWLESILVLPRYHHWHHGLEKEACDINFANQFPWLDRLFGTYHFPQGKWPKSYGINGQSVPAGYLAQLLYPLQSNPNTRGSAPGPKNRNGA